MKPKPTCAAAELVADNDRAAERECGEPAEATEPECLVVVELDNHRADRSRKLRNTVETDSVEVMTGDPIFDRARKLLDCLKASSRKCHEDRLELGRELLRIKTELGFTLFGPKNGRHLAGESSRTQFACDSPNRTWAQWTVAELRGMSHDTADRLITYAESFQMLGEALGEESPASQALRLPFELMGRSEIKAIHKAVEAMKEGKHRKYLVKAFGVTLERAPVLTGGDTSAFRKANLAKMDAEEASRIWKTAWESLAKGTLKILKFRRRQDLELWLYLLPLRSKNPEVIGLLEYRDKLATMLEDAKNDIQAILEKMDGFIAAKHESANAPVKRVRSKKQPTTNTKRKP